MMPKTPLLDSGRLNCQIPNHKAKILELSKKQESNSLYIEFIEKFLSYIPIDYDFENKQKLFFDFANEAFNFFKYREKVYNM